MNEKELEFINKEKERVIKLKELATIKFEKEGTREESKREVDIKSVEELGIWED